MKTTTLKKSEIEKKWWIADAEGQILGRLASKIAQILRGKHKTTFSPHLDMGDFVIVVNADKISLSGNKEKEKVYFRHTGFPGGVKETSLDHLRKTYPDRIITSAVRGMLPHNRLGRKIITHLKVYAGSNHPHLAQKPMELKV
tara:strand:- start:106 stop:534 length:429 start_codon:yes stop_codon:yes gene_type:complete